MVDDTEIEDFRKTTGLVDGSSFDYDRDPVSINPCPVAEFVGRAESSPTATIEPASRKGADILPFVPRIGPEPGG